MKLLLSAILALSAYAGPTISAITVDDVTAHGARIRWTTNVSSTGNRIQWGTVAATYPYSWTFTQDFGSTAHGWFLSGLAPATTYYFVVCSTNPDEACSSEQTVLTAAAESGSVTLPTLPTAVADMTVPGSFTDTLTVSADCLNLQTHLNTIAGNDGDNNYKVVIPAGTICGGRYTLPAKSGVDPTGTGMLVLTTDATLPPAGARLESTMLTSIPRIITNLVAVENYTTSTPACSEIGQGWLDSDSTNANAFLHWCTSTVGPVWTAVAMTSSTSPPGTCAVGDFHYDSDEADAHKRVSYCYETNKWLNWYIEFNNNITPYAAITVASGAKRWIVQGLRLERPTLPTSYTSLLPTAAGTGSSNGDQYPSVTRCLAVTESNNDRINFDQVYFDGVGYPHRMQDAFCFFRGTNVRIANGTFYKTNRWRPPSSLESTPNTINMTAAGGPFAIENNAFIDAHGITIFNGDDVSNGMMVDGTIRRNHFYESPEDNGLGLNPNGQRYFRRHMIECKRCSRWLVEGNIFDGGWPAGNQGATIAITPRSITVGEEVYAWDYTFRNNYIKWTPQAFLITGHNDYPFTQNKATNRIAITNNLIHGTGQASDGSTRGWPNNSQYNGQVMEVGLGIQNFLFSKNAMLGIKNVDGCCAANMLSHAGDWCTYKNSRLVFTNNIFTSLEASAGGWRGLQACGSNYFGSDSLNQMWQSGVGSPSWVSTGNAWQAMKNGAFSDGNTYPSNNYRTEDYTVWTGSLHTCVGCAVTTPSTVIPSSAMTTTARGNDGYPSGPDYVVLESALGNTRGVAARATGATTATVTYTAPDATACTVEYGTSSSELTGTRVLDSGGARGRSVALTGLTTATAYHYRVYCAGMVAGTFTTQ